MVTDTDSAELARLLVARAGEVAATVATAESCTGGLVGSAITAVPGSSAIYLGGCITYSNDAKTALLGVTRDVLAGDGAVSERCARQMADGVRNRLGATLAVSITGIAGPGGGTREKPIGTVWIGLATAEGARAEAFRFSGDRAEVRRASTVAALKAILSELTSG